MEKLKEELDRLVLKLSDTNDFLDRINSLTSIYPFSEYEYIISKLLISNVLSYDEYLDLRDEYISRNLYLNIFELSPRSFGDSWGFGHLKTIEPTLEKATKKLDSEYKGEYDMVLPHNGEYIKIEVKASRVVDREHSELPLVQKALSSDSKAKFLMNFQQIKPSCCDVFVWIAVYRDSIRYWVMKNTIVQNHPDFGPQHRNKETENREVNYDKSKIFEGQIMITNSNIDSLQSYEVDSRQIRQAIVEQFGD